MFIVMHILSVVYMTFSLDGSYLFDCLVLLYLFVLVQVLLIGLFAVDISLLTGMLIFRTLGNGNELDLIRLLLPNSAPVFCYVCFCCGINTLMCMCLISGYH